LKSANKTSQFLGTPPTCAEESKTGGKFNRKSKSNKEGQPGREKEEDKEKKSKKTKNLRKTQ